MGRATEAEVIERTNVVAELLVRGADRQRVLQYAATNWGLADRQADTYIAKANKAIAESAAVERDHEIGRGLRRLHYLYNRAVQEGNLRIALEVVRETNKMLGLNAPTQVEVDDKREDRTLRDQDTTTLEGRLRALRANGGARAN